MPPRSRGKGAKDGLLKRRDSITFSASLPAMGSAIKLDGFGDEAEIRLVVPRSDAQKVLEVWQRWAQKELRVTVEADG